MVKENVEYIFRRIVNLLNVLSPNSPVSSSAIPSSPLSKDSFLVKHYRPDHHDYFFDRDPAVFHCVLNFFRTGELHLSTVTCGPVVKSELEFWGVDELDIEECCWSRYSSWVSTLQVRLLRLKRQRLRSDLTMDDLVLL